MGEPTIGRVYGYLSETIPSHASAPPRRCSPRAARRRRRGLGAAPECSWVFFADADGDAHGDPDASITACTLPAGHAANGDDCDDTDAAVHPGAAESCNAIDDDCDGAIDEDAFDASIWYADADGDGFGDRGSATTACAQPKDSSESGDDCDDADAAVNPVAEETCNAIDDDCDALVDAIDPTLVGGSTWYDDDDRDGYGDDATAVQACTQPKETVAVAGDCNDAVAAIGPDGAEVCDGIDNDCDGLTDDDDVVIDGWLYHADADGDGYGDPLVSLAACTQPEGYVYDVQDCDDTTAEVGGHSAYWPDDDGDGYGAGVSFVDSEAWCTPGPRLAPEWGDCDDDDPDVSPGAVEICNGIDDNCDDDVDADDPLVVMDLWYDDDDGDGYGDDASTTPSCDTVFGHVSVGGDCDDGDAAMYPGAAELCDGVDNDCTGTIDDDRRLLRLVCGRRRGRLRRRRRLGVRLRPAERLRGRRRRLRRRERRGLTGGERRLHHGVRRRLRRPRDRLFVPTRGCRLLAVRGRVGLPDR